jgi:hypothetical protein
MESLFPIKIPNLLPGHLPEEIIQGKILALNWKQPYAALMLHGKAETRTWNVTYRGWVLMCSSQAPFKEPDTKEIAGEYQFSRLKKTLHQSPHVMLLGKAFALGYLYGCKPMIEADEDACFVKYRRPKIETSTSHFPDGTIVVKEKEVKLYCHFYKNVVPINPFAWDGSQGWKIVDEQTKRRIIVK